MIRQRIRIWVAFIFLIVGCKGSQNQISLATDSPCKENVLQGYTDHTSYLAGEKMLVYVHSNSPQNCCLNIYDVLGRVVLRVRVNLFPQTMQSEKPWENGFGYRVSAEIKLPTKLASGFYTIENVIPFIVRSSAASDVTIVYPVNTINAYNPSGGKSLYRFNSTSDTAATAVSFLRPMTTTHGQDCCDQCLKWFPSLPSVKANYLTDIDMENWSSFERTKILIIIGHSEYWTLPARVNFDRFINKGGHGLILSGNTMYWQARYSKSNSVLTCYRDAAIDPEPNQSLKTVRWSDPTLRYPILSSIGADFVHGGYGLKEDTVGDGTEIDDGWNGFKIVDPTSPLFEGLHFQKGEVLSLPTREYDGASIKGFDNDGYPILDNDKLKFERLELIGFDKGWRGKETIPTFIVMQKTKTSGIVINVASTDWCSSAGIGSIDSGNQIKIITRNAIVKLLHGQSLFSDHSESP